MSGRRGGTVLRLVLPQLARTAAVLLLVGFGAAFLLDLAPGDPAFALLGEQATAEQIAATHRALHLDDPFLTRYWTWMSGVVRGDFGTSYLTGEPVMASVAARLEVTGELVLLALAGALAVSVPIGVLTAHRADGRADRAWSLVSSGLIATPPFVLALFLAYVLALKVGGLPATGWAAWADGPGANLRHAALPAATLALALVPTYSRMLRADMIATLQEDHILAARSRGLPVRRILFRHALRPSSFSLVTLTGISIGQLISGAVVVEVLFALPGLGQLVVTSVTAKDVPVVQGVVMFLAVVYCAAGAVTDVLYGCLDPRVRVRPT
ncbi:ABC transporter permease [Parafrankia colletiae]|uniref:ABC transporter permease n=1 Tax=Parafrankia colletiae TaxID=573497 RepID=A0A1S1R3F0_9ACTN|nr:ABC transporter permease [Parafrankia colletiae]MCK9900260.1 ABC transporter permease [Frankia sp. Cpl3]OHV40299.1 ABC transporter permease [Parafrankia colletiae]